MKHNISETSRLGLSGDVVTLQVHYSTTKMLVGWLSMTAGLSVFVVSNFYTLGMWYDVLACILFVYGIISLGYKQLVVIDLKQKVIQRRSDVLNVNFYKTSVFFESGSKFKYIISFNSLERISFISLVIYSNGKEEPRFVMDFPEAKAFFAFKKIFNQTFPDFEITETYLSKKEFAAAEVHRKQIKSNHSRVLRHKDHLL